MLGAQGGDASSSPSKVTRGNNKQSVGADSAKLLKTIPTLNKELSDAQ